MTQSADLVTRLRAHAIATPDEKAAALLSGAADRIDALAAGRPCWPEPATLADLLRLADAAAQILGSPMPITPRLQTALRNLQDRVAGHLDALGGGP